MALTIGQITAVSYPMVLAEKRKPTNQWAESSAIHTFEKMGFIKHESLGDTIETPLDYQRNPGTVILATDLQSVSTAKTEVITSASYAIAEVSAPIVWSKKDEVRTAAKNQKIPFATALMSNAIESHDDILEQDMFLATTNGMLGFQTLIPYSGQGSVGGIDASVNTFWRNQFATYIDDTDIESTFTTLWNACAKASGTMLMPTLILSDGPTQALFESTQQSLQRWSNTDEMKAGFKKLKFKNADYIFSQYGNGRAYFLNPRNFNLVVSKEYFRDMGEAVPFTNANGFIRLVYSAVQFVTNNKSRLGVASTAALA